MDHRIIKWKKNDEDQREREIPVYIAIWLKERAATAPSSKSSNPARHWKSLYAPQCARTHTPVLNHQKLLFIQELREKRVKNISKIFKQ